MQEILWSEKYEFSVGPLFLRNCMLEQTSLIDSGFFDFVELGPGMSPAKRNKIRKAVLFFTAIFRWQMKAGEYCAKNRDLKNKEGDKPSQNFKF